MRHRFTAAIGILALAALLAQTMAASADEWGPHHYRHHHAHYVRVTYAEPQPYYYPACRVGWWQSLRYGRVHPYWSALCR